MKLTLQLIVVVLNAPTKFRDNLFKFTLHTIIIIYKVGDTRWGACTWQISLKYKVKQSKNGKFTSNYKASPIEFETQVSLRR